MREPRKAPDQRQPFADRLDYWWHKENYRRLTAELPLSRVNSARKIFLQNLFSQYKICGGHTVKSAINNNKKNTVILTELKFTQWNKEIVQQFRKNFEEYLSGLIALINGELTADFYQDFTSQAAEIFLLPETFIWQCSCPGALEHPETICEHVLALLLRLLEDCKYMPIILFELRGFGLPEIKQLFFDLPADDSGRAELPVFLQSDFYQPKTGKQNFPKEWLDDYYGRHCDFSETIAKELEPFREQRYYHHRFNRDFYDALDALKNEMAKFWHTQD